MPVKKYIPPKEKVIDHRKPEGGYYISVCDNCGTEFYPQRINAKYCTPNCTLISWRKAKAEGKPVKNPKAKPGDGQQKAGKAEKPVDYSKYSHEQLLELMQGLKAAEIQPPKELIEAWNKSFRAKFGNKGNAQLKGI